MAMVPCKEYTGVKFQPLLKYYLLKLVDIIYKSGIPKFLSAHCSDSEDPEATSKASTSLTPLNLGLAAMGPAIS